MQQHRQRILAYHDIPFDPTRQADSQGEVNALYLRGLRDYLLRRDVAPERFLAQFGLDASVFDASRRRLSTGLYERLLVSAGEALDDADVGLHVGECIRPGHYGVLGFAVMACRVAEEVYRRHARYEQLVASIGKSRYEPEGDDQIRLTWDTGQQRLHRAVFDETLASWVTFARWLVNRQDHDATCIYFPYPRPADIREHQRIFRCPLVFDAPLTALTFPRSYLDIPLAQSDPALCRLMDQRAEAELKALGGDDWLTRVRREIMTLLAEGEVSLGRVAGRLGISERALQRRLQEQGFSYQQVLDATRQTLALKYVRDEQFSLAEVAFLLGFADQSAFNRAFRQWTGETPGHYRRQHRHQNP